MSRSSSQPVDLEHQDVPIAVPTLAEAVLALKAHQRKPVWNWLSICSFCVGILAAGLIAAFGGAFGIPLAIVFISTTIMSARSELAQHQSEHQRLTNRLLEEIVAQQNEHRRLLEKLSRSVAL